MCHCLEYPASFWIKLSTLLESCGTGDEGTNAVGGVMVNHKIGRRKGYVTCCVNKLLILGITENSDCIGALSDRLRDSIKLESFWNWCVYTTFYSNF
jgi:hypothetical protein